MSEYVTYLKVGTASLVLAMIEAGYSVTGMELEDPVKAIREISRDPTLNKKVRLDDGRQMTAIELQRVYLDRAGDFLATHDHEPILDDVSKSGNRSWTDWNEIPWNWSGKSTG